MKKSLVLLYLFILTACSNIMGFSFSQDRRDGAVIATDERIESSASIELSQLDGVKEHSHFNITSYNAKVLVTGEVENEEVREKIISNIRIISGIKLVHNELVIAPLSTVQSRRDDDLLTVKVKDALEEVEDKPGFDASRIKVITENKVVYLMGIVHEEEGVIAAEAVQNVEGVRKIIAVFEYMDYSGNK